MNNDNHNEKSSLFDIWYPRVMLVCMAASIACNFIQLAGGFPKGMWQFGFLPVVICALVASMRDMIKEGRPNLSPVRIKRRRMNLVEIIVRGIFLLTWLVSLVIVIVKG